MGKKRTLRLSIRVLLIPAILISVVSLYNLFTFLSGVISSDSFGLDLKRNEVTGDWTFTLNGNPRNGGFLDVSLFLELTILDISEQVIAKNSTSVYIRAGSSQRFSLALTIPADMIPGGELQEARGYMQMKMTLRILSDLIGLTQIMRIGSGGT